MYCSTCGAVSASGSFCGACGAPMGSGAAGAVAGPAPESGAGFWKRCVALMLDSMIFLVPAVILAILLAVGTSSEWMGNIVLLAAWWLYFALQESSERQATLGKRAMGIMVTDADGGRLSFGRASGRHLAAVLNYATLSIGYVLAGLTQRKQGLHDMAAGTLVVNRSGNNPLPVWAIVLLVALVLAIPMLGILAAIAIPAYQDYTVRAKVSQGLAEAGPVKLAYAEALLSAREPPASLAAIGLAPARSSWGTVDVKDGLIIISYAADSGLPAGANTLALEPMLDTASGDRVSWICGHQAYPGTEQPKAIVRASAADYTTVERRRLPASCR
jgi:uncharacterized RDD family membrane protein YckC/Tfp pilus assembly major pilin PilA